MTFLIEEEIDRLRVDARSVVRELGLLNDAYFDFGVTLAERHLLIELNSYPSSTAKEIAERLHIDKSTISRLIAKAEKKGYVRCILDQVDKRKRVLFLTEIGKKTLNAFEPIAFMQTQKALSTLAPSEVELVYKGISLYAKGLKNGRLQNVSTNFSKKQQSKDKKELANSSTTLQLPGFDLKPFCQEDEEGLYKIFREVVDAGNKFPYESSSIQEFYRQFLNPKWRVFVCHSSSNEIVGGFYIGPNFSGRSSHIANAAYMVKNNYRGRGIGTFLIKASLEIAENLGFHGIQFNMVLSQNLKAIALYKKLGFNVIGTIPQAIRNPDGSYQDGYIYYKKVRN